VRIRVLGPVELVRAGGAPGGLERRAREVLTVLALQAPDAVTLDELTALLWDDPPPTAVRSLQSHLSRVRAALATLPDGVATLQRTGDAYALRVAPGALDVDLVADRRRQAGDALAEGDHDRAAALLAAARSVWRGPVELPATTAARAVEARWAHERRALAQDHLAAVIDGSGPASAVPELRSVTVAEPQDERAWELLVRALGRSGRRTEALRAAQDARAALADVGLDPGPALRAAEAEVLAGADDSAAADPGVAVPGGGPDGDAGPPSAPAGAGGRGGVARSWRSAPAGGGQVGPRPIGPATAAPVRYARSGPLDIAYLAFGAGPPDVLVLDPGAISIDAIADQPLLTGPLDRLAARARVLTLDRRGLGLSDRPADPSGDGGAATATVDEWVDDVVAVLDDAGADRVVVLAASDTGLVALALAARRPDRVAHLVLVHGYARYVRADDYPFGVDAATARSITEDARATGPGGPDRFDPLSHVAPSVARDPDVRRWWDGAGRRAASPAAAAALQRAVLAADVRPLLPRVTVPVTLIHRRACTSCDVGHARYLADHLARAQLVTVPGADELWFAGDVEPIVARVEAALGDI